VFTACYTMGCSKCKSSPKFFLSVWAKICIATFWLNVNYSNCNAFTIATIAILETIISSRRHSQRSAGVSARPAPGLPVFTDSERRSASSSNWRSLSTELFTELHLSTCQTGCSTSLICRDVEAGCARRPPVFSTSARRGVSSSSSI